MKLSDLHRTGRKKQRNDGSDDDDDDESDEEGQDETDDDPTLDHINIPHRGGVNRVRSMPQRLGVVATWSETSDVHIWDLEEQVSALAAKGAQRKSKVDPAFTFDGHMEASAVRVERECVCGCWVVLPLSYEAERYDTTKAPSIVPCLVFGPA